MQKQSQKPQNVDKFYVIETPKGIYVHKTLDKAELHRDALEIDFGKRFEIHTCPQLTIFEIVNTENHKPVYLRGAYETK